MTLKEAIHILMQSPFYFRIKLEERKLLVREFLSYEKKITEPIRWLKS